MEGVHAFASGEGERIVTIRITLVVVNDGIGKVDRVGHVGFEGIKQRDGDTPSVGLNLWLLDLWGRDDHPFRRIVHLHYLVELNRYPLHILLVSGTKLG